ncbi:Stk1 family PASTA domain-containing Ser/Thr kinase [Aeromicrobium sp. Leaf350]|uniref:Stk1 family PASTA domain-containing Ser/Thr kinase n=1 Tax=Aeromicrobium sp. Leaf350 TaxID=2876565 RepID=UPI001E54D1FF|nr:Stk1 family PASTA domain-containing Ser/Thr kinase [Aeromicrobium sp. Leaf350]
MTDSDSSALLGGRYQLGDVLGRGGMADVRIGQDLRLGRTVAVKQLRPDLASDPTFQERFRREAQSAAALNHPSIVAVYDTGEAPNEQGTSIPYIVMERVEGQTLREVLRDGRKILPERAMTITADILAALDYSHRSGIIHRDIKPANVMLTPSGQVKVMDFGIARAIADASSAMTQTAAVIGTAQYLSPEQARGETVDARSDIYSTGCLLYELLTGRPPFVGDSPVSVAYQHVREEARPPSQLNPDVSMSIDHIVAKSLAKRVDDRYQSAGDMRRDIERAIAGQRVDAPTTTVPPVGATQVAPAVAAPREPGARRAVDEDESGGKGKWWAIGALVVLLLAGAAFGIWKLTEPEPAATPTVEIPDTAGQTVDAATGRLTEAGLTVSAEPQERADATVPAGQVIGTDPEAGETVDEGTEVTLIVSTGPEPFDMPDVRDLTYDQAAANLQAQGLQVTREDRDSEQQKDTVIQSNPPAGTSVLPGQTVTLIVSKGQIQVPDVTGMDVATAISTLTTAGFDPAKIAQQTEATLTDPPGTVLEQSLSPGSRVSPDSSIALTVAAAVGDPGTDTDAG